MNDMNETENTIEVFITEPEPAPELDLSPLTEEEFQRLQLGDTVTFGNNKEFVWQVVIKADRVSRHVLPVGQAGVPCIVLSDEASDICPTPATARRLGRGVKSE
jgi:hypothetical protein